MALCVIVTCCCCCSVRVGTFIIGALSLIFSSMAVGYFTAFAVGLETLMNKQFADALEEELDEEDPAEGSRFWTAYNSAVSKWNRKLFGISIGLASVHALTFVFACLLIHGSRKYRAGLMIPWLVTEAVKTVAAMGFGLVVVGMAPSWAKKLGAAAALSGVSWPSDQFVQAVLMAHGVFLIVVFLVGGYFVCVVLASYKEVKISQSAVRQEGCEQNKDDFMIRPVKPMPYF